MKVEGRIVKIQDTQQLTEKFSKREFWMEVSDGMYAQTISLQFTKDKCNVLNGYNVGDQVAVEFNLNGRTHTNAEGVERCYNSLDAWKINKTDGNSQPVADLPFG